MDALGQHFALVRQTFGRELPSENHLQSNEGQHDGEVQFTIDGGGDILAHTWSASQFQWVNVGLFSYRRNAIEGALGVRQLKGQKIGSVMPSNQIELFIALAKQFEEENSIAAISPASYQTSSSRSLPPRVAVPLVPPRPRRPAMTFSPSSDMSRSLSSTGHDLQKTDIPTTNTFISSQISSIQRSVSKMSEDRTSFLGVPPPSVSLYESQSSSPTNLHEVNPLNRRQYSLGSVANKTFNASSFLCKPSRYAPSPAGTSTSEEVTPAGQAKERQFRIWREEQLRLQHNAHVSLGLGASRDTHFQEEQVTNSHGRTAFPQYRPLSPIFGSGTSDATLDVYQTWFNLDRGEKVAWPDRNEYSIAAPRPKKNGFSWDDIASCRPIDEVQKQFGADGDSIYRIAGTGISMTACPGQPSSIQEPKVPYTSLTTIGNSQIDDAWEDRKIQIWSPIQNDTVRDGNVNCAEVRLSHEVRGPFFAALDDPSNEEGWCGDREDRLRQLWNRLEDVRAERTDILKKIAKSLRDEGGVPLNKAKVVELATDPLSHMLWAVKHNLRSYKETPAHSGDYFQWQFKKPRPELIDHSATGNKSFFTSSCPNSDDLVVFMGRSSQLGSSSQSRELARH
jgi:hypothetical protein